MADYRDVGFGDAPITPGVPAGRRVVVAIGIDTYRNWGRLKNAVSDALGVHHLFRQLGFEEVVPPLLNDAATFDAMRRLVVTDLRKLLGEDDSLVLFFAGHGYTETSTLQGTAVRVGYIIPFDSDASRGDAGTWLELEAWLKDVARLPARHILVILDSCHSGMALEVDRARGMSSEPPAQLLSRRSRRVITSAQDNQQALDNGPVADHSLFTGLLVRALQGEIAGEDRAWVTGTELAVHLQRRVSEHRNNEQTPDFGALSWDAGGDMAIPVLNRTRPESSPSVEGPPTPTTRRTAPWWHRRVGRVLMVAAALAVGAMLGVHVWPGASGSISGGSGGRGASTGDDAGPGGDAAVGDDVPAGSDAGIDKDAKVDDAIATVVLDAGVADGAKPIEGRDSGAIVRSPVHCYRLPTGGYAPGAPTCASRPVCNDPDPALSHNPDFEANHCKQLCTCP